MTRFTSMLVLGLFLLASTGCGSSGGNTVVEAPPEPTQEEKDAYSEQALGATESSN